MRFRCALLAALGACLALPVAASAHPVQVVSLEQTLGNATAALTSPPNDGGANFATSRNMKLLGFSERRVAPNDFNRFNTDLAFWGDKAYQGQFNGFRILDVDNPRRPRELLNYEGCGSGANGGQGDVVVWGSVLVRAWDVNAGAESVRATARSCPPGFEGMHVFDVSDTQQPGARRERRSAVRHAHADRSA